MELLWSMSTTVREAERIQGFLKVAKKMEGESWDAAGQRKYQILLVQYREYLNNTTNTQSFRKLNDEQIEWLIKKELDMPYSIAESIIDSKKYVGGADMRGRQSMAPLKKLGLVYVDGNNKIRISDIGNRFINDEITVVDMKNKKINTIPHGGIIILINCLALLLTVLVSILLIPKQEGYIMLILSAIFVVALGYYIHTKHTNYIYISREGIRHADEEYDWSELYITMDYSRPIFARNSFDYYFYFDSKYLSVDEIKDPKIKKKGFYMIINTKRLNEILPFYKKEVKILKESSFAKKVLETVKKYNNELTENNSQLK